VSEALPPGWYEDPWHGPGVRWWDGLQWTTHTAVPHGSAPAPPPPVVWTPPAQPPRRRPPWWVWTLAALGVIVPVAAFAAIIVGASNESNVDLNFGYTTPSFSPPITPNVPTPAPPQGLAPGGAQPPHSLRAGPAAPGEALRIYTRDGEVRVSVLDVVDPVARGGYYRGPRSGTRWVGVRMRIANVGATTYEDDPANDTRLVAGRRTLQADSALLTTCDVFPVQVRIPSGQSRSGCVIFEVPRGTSPRQLRFASDSYFGPELGTFVLGR
jgi:hypothetical protein